MEPQKFNWSVMVIAVGCGAVFLFVCKSLMPSPQDYVVKDIHVISTGPTVVRKTTPSGQVVQPVATTAPAQNVAPVGDPHADLKTALPDMARLLRHGGRPALRLAYYPPDFLASLAPATVQQLQAQAAAAAQQPPNAVDEAVAKVYDSLVNQTPIMNDAGDVASYPLVAAMFANPDVPEGVIPSTMMLVKIDGKWYMTNPATEANRSAVGTSGN